MKYRRINEEEKKEIEKFKKEVGRFKLISKSERLMYVIMIMWIIFGVLGIYLKADLTQLAGYYTSLTVFISTYLWGEYRRTSQSTPLFTKGPNSTREIVIIITIVLWILTGFYGLYKHLNFNNLTVYFSALTPFVGSYIIYKTVKGPDIPDIMNKIEDTVQSNVNPVLITNGVSNTTTTTVK
jgi:hypothetical protein